MAAFDFKFNLPLGEWEDQTTYIFKGPTVDDLEHYLMMVIDRHLETASLEEYTKERTKLITSSLEDVDVIKDTKITLPGDIPMNDLLIKWTVAPQVVRYKRYMFTIKHGMGFTLNCDFTMDSYRAVSHQVTRVVTALFAEDDTPAPKTQPPQGMNT